MKQTKVLPILAVALCLPGVVVRALHMLNGFDIGTGLPAVGDAWVWYFTALLVLAAVGCAVWAAVRMLLHRRAKRPRTPGPGPRGPMAPRGATEQKAPDAPPDGPEKNGPGEERPHGI